MTAPTRWPDNVPGRFYVSHDCIICSVCTDAAPTTFATSDDGGHTYVYAQPQTADEIAAALDARDGCPVDAIVDGDTDGG